MSAEPCPKKLLDQVRDAVRLKHYSYRTEQTYVQWIRRFILFHNKLTLPSHPAALASTSQPNPTSPKPKIASSTAP